MNPCKGAAIRATTVGWTRIHRGSQAARRRGGLAVVLASVGLALGLAPLGLAHAAAASGACATSGDQVTCTYTYTGAAQTWTVPAGVSAATFDVFGAAGGFDCNGGGLGGEALAAIPVVAGATLQITVGGSGDWHRGFNGGGAPGFAPNGTGGAGGGASDVRGSPFTLADRLIVGGGGGGGLCVSGDGGNGGGLTGASGASRDGGNGAGGSQTAGGAGVCGQAVCDGSLGLGGPGGGDGDSGGGGGGGGGYYGGGGGGASFELAAGEGAGGGGSSYVTPLAITSSLIQGDNSGDGRVVITYAVPGTATHVTTSANPSLYGQQLTLTATVAGGPGITPTGTVTFTDGTTTLGTATLNSSGTATFSTSSLGAGSHSITVVYGGDATDLGSASTALDQQVAPAPLTITANDQSMTYGDSVPAFTASENGFVNGDTSSVVSGLSCGASDGNGQPVSSGTPVGSYPITCAGATAANYSISYQAGTLTINPAALTITANDQAMTYGGSLPSLDASDSGFVNGDSVASLSTAPTCSASATSSSPVGSYPITCAGAVDPNYTISYVAGTLTIGPAPLTISASSPSMTYDGTVPAITPDYSGFVNDESAASLTAAPACASNAPGDGAAGTYTTSCTGAVDPNYSISYQGGTLTISPAAQTISFVTAPPSLTLVGTTYAVSATGGASGNPVTFTASPSSVCTSSGANGATITLVGVGACTVTASQAGNANYLPAPSVGQSFAVSYPPLSLALSLSSSPPGPATTGSLVTASMTLGNHTTASQTVTLKVSLAYRGSGSSLTITVPLTLKLSAGQTLSKSASFTISRWFPRGSYTLRVAASDGSGDTASSSAALTVS